ncbi:TetR/AcrR family transcriptional regulator C-terminal ligand-binding domain-containing protein [Mycobacterium malmoense]|uniref:TetR family transcriptional regulator n=1 Tax=Mycobacterium malmoense TaxID=1780 RepID=A0ABX3SP58_MYCMA|nr:TetR-like C-terminal domain-containing protein [Mycobacterium malmoense]OIN79643.1 TetR family transcriptional regulator [Mycobacterium malmoense]ORA80243.1 TetR family transcriptional regulator [Mycobacterium malmoense]QZA15992.1 TetR/AcrR family transcriptional regulator C-terminal ligand-binding domain-containing protein [Mycobacterium malmoense]UNB92803.1 TetR/AcrR family transcriptional regulator C-terminal ligand-binding domain-containing protein [Mycobacterium malmoense]
MKPPQPPNEPVPADIRASVMAAVLDELARWGVERFSVEALAERHRLDAAMIYRYWGDRQRLIVDAALADVETLSAATDTGSLRGDLRALARNVADRINTEEGRTFLRALVMDRRGHHDEDTRMKFWRARFAVVRAVVDRARERGELREGVNTLAAVQIVLAPLNIRALYSDADVDDDYCVAIADMAWHALARR